MNMILIGKRIREQREMQNLKQEQLAEMAKISNVHLSGIERGKKVPSIESFINIVNALNIPSDYLLRDEINGSKQIILNDITEKMKDLTPKQVEYVSDMFNLALKNFAIFAGTAETAE